MLALLAILTGWYLICRNYVINEKQRAWIITLSASIILSYYGLYTFCEFAYNWFNINHMLSYTLTKEQMFPHHVFMSYLIIDLVIGMIDYRKQINLVTGWVHHIMYLIICWNYQYSKYSSLLLLCYIVEIPTFILGLCKFYPHIDVLKRIFTIVFFISRICGLGLITIKCIWNGEELGVLISFILSLCLNGYWFSKMIKIL